MADVIADACIAGAEIATARSKDKASDKAAGETNG
jgi:hypothetical protein